MKEKWCDRTGKELTPGERKRIQQRWAEAERQREQAEAERQTKARETAAWILSRATPATTHPYLEGKQVGAHGTVQLYREALVIPLRDEEGVLHSLQFIGQDGSKKFLGGGRVNGCYYTVAHTDEGPLVIAEGYATAASIHQASGYATVAAMNCGNLEVVGRALRKKYPQRDIIVAADNDQFTTDKEGKPYNPGVAKATETAKAIRARLAIPAFKDTTTKPTDFNDLAALEGHEAVKAQVEAAALPKETDEEVVARLATLPPLEYERVRKQEAERLGCRESVLDKLVEGKREKEGDDDLQGSSVDRQDIEPWHEPVNGAAILDAIAVVFSGYLVLPPGAADALALWCAHTHVSCWTGLLKRLEAGPIPTRKWNQEISLNPLAQALTRTAAGHKYRVPDRLLS